MEDNLKGKANGVRVTEANNAENRASANDETLAGVRMMSGGRREDLGMGLVGQLQAPGCRKAFAPPATPWTLPVWPPRTHLHRCRWGCSPAKRSAVLGALPRARGDSCCRRPSDQSAFRIRGLVRKVAMILVVSPSSTGTGDGSARGRSTARSPTVQAQGRENFRGLREAAAGGSRGILVRAANAWSCEQA